MSASYLSEPLNVHLNFRLTEKAAAKAGAQLLAQGDYDATELRTYGAFQTCHGCGTREKAKKLVVVRDRVTLETFEIGLQCMGDLYGIDIGMLTDHANAVARTRRNLGLKLNLSGDLSTERQIAIVREAVQTYVPLPERFISEIDGFDLWGLHTPDLDRLRDLHQVAQYHRDWAERAERALMRWKALRGHPAFVYSSKGAEVQKACDRAVEARSLLPVEDVIRLNGFLREAAKFKHKLTRLVAPEAFDNRETYMQALEAALDEQVRLGQRVAHLLHGEGQSHRFNPATVAGLDAGTLYAVAGVWDDDAAAFKDRIDATGMYWKRGQRPLVKIGPVDVEHFPAVERTRLNLVTNEYENYVAEPAWSFRYRRVAWGLAEPYSNTYRYWRSHGRDALERYT